MINISEENSRNIKNLIQELRNELPVEYSVAFDNFERNLDKNQCEESELIELISVLQNCYEKDDYSKQKVITEPIKKENETKEKINNLISILISLNFFNSNINKHKMRR